MPTLAIEETNGAVTVSFDRPEKRNPLDLDVVRELDAVIEDLDGTQTGLLIRGNGPVTCAGADLAIVRDGSDAEQRQLIAEIETVFEKIHHHPAPTVYAVRGAAVGAGFQLAMVCDFAVLGEETVLYKPEIAFGVYSEWTTRMIEHAVGAQIAREITLTCGEISPERAAGVGIATEVVPNDAVDETAETLLETLLSHDLEAYRIAKSDLRFDRSPDDCRSYP